MPGEDLESALAAAEKFATDGMGSVLTQLGENVSTAAEADAVRDHYLRVFEQVRARGVPAHVSVKLTQLGLDQDPGACEARVRALASAATGTMLAIDMEDSSYVDATLGIYRRVLQDHPGLGVCLQAYLHRTPADLDALLPLRPSIRLVKGAYREEAVAALQDKREVDARYLELARTLLEAARNDQAFPIFGTHDMGLVAAIWSDARQRALGAGAWEVHMLYGIRTEDQGRLAADGVTVRVLLSYGSAWFPWYMRRLAEKPSNLWFVFRNLV